LLSVRQPVTIKFDSFPYSIYGAATGRLSEIAPSSEHVGEQADSFPAHVTFASSAVQIRGHDITLKPGMKVRVDIKIGERPVLQQVLGPDSKMKR
jgi:hemolysin D